MIDRFGRIRNPRLRRADQATLALLSAKLTRLIADSGDDFDVQGFDYAGFLKSRGFVPNADDAKTLRRYQMKRLESKRNPAPGMGKLTKAQMERALQTGFDRQGRTMGPNQQARYMQALDELKPGIQRFEYRGLEVEGIPGTRAGYRVHQDGRLWPMSFTSKQQARDAIDRMWAVREMMSE